MIGKISGILDFRASDHVLLDVRGVGYIVFVNERTLASLPPIGQAVSLYTDLLVREDLLQLFGFLTLLEKEWYRLLTTVQGVGAKAAMSILGTLGTDGVTRALTLGDQRAIQAAPGVGPKLAQRICLELKSKAPTILAIGGKLSAAAESHEVIEQPMVPSRAAKPAALPDAQAASIADALSALVNLGYGHGDAAQAVTTAAGGQPTAATGELIRAALKLLAPKGS